MMLMLMDILKIIGNKCFNDIKNILQKEPYHISVKESYQYPNLYMLVYNNELSDFSLDSVCNCRGIILEKETNQVISYTFNKKVDISINDCDKIYESIDGSHIKLYYYNGEWVKSTTRYIDAYNAYWYSDKSFGDLFDECDNGSINYDILNKNYCYGFVICHKENRIVTNYSENKLVHVCTRDLSSDNYSFVETDIGICKPKELNQLDLKEYEKNNNDKEGIIVWKDGNHNKIKFESYNKVKRLRINTNNPLFEYITNLCNGNKDLYTQIYIERNRHFIDYEKKINNIVNRLHRNYMDYHVNKIKLIKQINKAYWKHMYNLHGFHMNDNKIITKDVVRDYLVNLDPPQVMHIINVVDN